MLLPSCTTSCQHVLPTMSVSAIRSFSSTDPGSNKGVQAAVEHLSAGKVWNKPPKGAGVDVGGVSPPSRESEASPEKNWWRKHISHNLRQFWRMKLKEHYNEKDCFIHVIIDWMIPSTYSLPAALSAITKWGSCPTNKPVQGRSVYSLATIWPKGPATLANSSKIANSSDQRFQFRDFIGGYTYARFCDSWKAIDWWPVWLPVSNCLLSNT